MRTGGIWLCFSLAAVVVGCGTIHPRAQADLPEKLRDCRTVAMLYPDIRVAVSYTGTSMLMYSPTVSQNTASLVQAAAEKHLEDAGFSVESLDAISFVPSVQADTLLPWIHTGFETPEGVPRTDRPVLPTRRARRVAAAEAVLSVLVSADPDYQTALLPPELTYDGPVKDLQEYDLVMLVFGTARAETSSESYWRWAKNLTLNLVMLPIAAAGFLIPFALPLSISLSFFFERTPDRAFFGMVCFDPNTRRVEYVNDFYWSGAARDEDAVYAVERMLGDFPTRNPNAE